MSKSNTPHGVTDEELHEARHGLLRLLVAKGFAWAWIERNLSRLLSEGQAVLAARAAAGCQDERVDLLVVLAYRRSQTAPSGVTAPFSFALDDRVAHLLRALRDLPERQCKLLSLVFFAGLSVKEAGRQLGWSPATSLDQQRQALEGLQELVGERVLDPEELAAPAAVASDYTLPKRHLTGWREASRGLAEVVSLSLHRLVRGAGGQAPHLNTPKGGGR